MFDDAVWFVRNPTASFSESVSPLFIHGHVHISTSAARLDIERTNERTNERHLISLVDLRGFLLVDTCLRLIVLVEFRSLVEYSILSIHLLKGLSPGVIKAIEPFTRY